MASRKTRNKAKQAERDENERRTSKGASIIAWIMLAMILVGLGGFGITNFGGGVTNVASVGGTEISTQDYARALKSELQAISAQTGQNVTFQQARAMGLDRQVLSRLIVTAALDDEDSRVGVSVGNDKLRADITSMRAFKGADGKFSREAYKFVLRQNGLTEGQFETKMRDEMARGILQDAVMKGIGVPQPYVHAVMAYAGARRGFEILKLSADDLKTPVPVPTEAQLMTYYKAHPKSYTSLPAKRITYAKLLPDMVAPTIKIDEKALRDAYDKNKADYVKPERRVVDRLVYPSEAAAQAAAARFKAGTATFEDLVKARGLTMDDVAMDDVTRDKLSSAAGAAVFKAADNSVVGPLQSALGPALFRVNAILPADTTTFAEAKPDLMTELQQEQARHNISTRIEHLNDLLAGGATLEQMAKETPMKLGTIDFNAKSNDGIAGYEAFRKAAQKVTADDYPEIIQLDDGGVVALRLDKEVKPALEPFAKVKDKVTEDWTTAETDKMLMAQAQAAVKSVQAGADLSTEGPVMVQDPIVRTGYIDGAPPHLMSGVFEMKKGEVKAFPGDEEVWVVKLTQELPPAMDDPDMKKLQEQLRDGARQGIANDAFLLFANAIQATQGITVNQQAVNAVNAQFH